MRVPDRNVLGGRGQGHRLHAAYLIERGLPFRQEVSMLRHGRSARLVDGADEVHLSQIAQHVIEAVRSDGSTRRATGLELL